MITDGEYRRAVSLAITAGQDRIGFGHPSAMQKTIAQKVGIRPATLSAIVNRDVSPTFLVLDAIASYFIGFGFDFWSCFFSKLPGNYAPPKLPGF